MHRLPGQPPSHAGQGLERPFRGVLEKSLSWQCLRCQIFPFTAQFRAGQARNPTLAGAANMRDTSAPTQGHQRSRAVCRRGRQSICPSTSQHAPPTFPRSPTGQEAVQSRQGGTGHPRPRPAARTALHTQGRPPQAGTWLAPAGALGGPGGQLGSRPLLREQTVKGGEAAREPLWRGSPARPPAPPPRCPWPDRGRGPTVKALLGPQRSPCRLRTGRLRAGGPSPKRGAETPGLRLGGAGRCGQTPVSRGRTQGPARGPSQGGTASLTRRGVRVLTCVQLRCCSRARPGLMS